MKSLILSPHDDDNVLFAAFTCMREKPLVVICTDSWIQQNRGENITPEQRMEETNMACDLLGCPVVRLGLRDDVLTEWALRRALQRFHGFETVYAPAQIVPGNKHHNMVGQIAKEVFGQTKEYMTYATNKLYVEGSEEVTPTLGELELKEKALACFTSQINLSATKPHFEAIEGKSEWFI
jgi:LmbE family N-acetylglucosaminyl deacetylase